MQLSSESPPLKCGVLVCGCWSAVRRQSSAACGRVAGAERSHAAVEREPRNSYRDEPRKVCVHSGRTRTPSLVAFKCLVLPLSSSSCPCRLCGARGSRYVTSSASPQQQPTDRRRRSSSRALHRIPRRRQRHRPEGGEREEEWRRREATRIRHISCCDDVALLHGCKRPLG